MSDFVLDISRILEKITGIKSAVETGDDQEVLRLAKETDWTLLIDEFESVVSGYQLVVRKTARAAIGNLLQPFVEFADESKLMGWKMEIEQAIEDSPSLAETADQEVAIAWESQAKLAKNIEKHASKGFRQVSPILTLTDLNREIETKQKKCWDLERTSPAYCRGERIPRP